MSKQSPRVSKVGPPDVVLLYHGSKEWPHRRPLLNAFGARFERSGESRLGLCQSSISGRRVIAVPLCLRDARAPQFDEVAVRRVELSNWAPGGWPLWLVGIMASAKAGQDAPARPGSPALSLAVPRARSVPVSQRSRPNNDA